MKKWTLLIGLPLFIAGCGESNPEQSQSNMNTTGAPICKKDPHEMTMHGHTRIDDYFWLKNRDREDVLDYLNAENAYTKKELAHTEDFQKTLFEEMKGRIKEDDSSAPYFDNGFYYITRYATGKEYPVYVRKAELEQEDEILLDVNTLAEGKEYYQVGGLEVSPNNKILAYGYDDISRRLYNLVFKDLETGELYTETIPNTTGGVAWANDNKTVFYTRKDLETLRSFQVWKHKLGTPSDEDELVYEEKDETFDTFVYKTKSNAFLVIGSTSTLTSEYQTLSADDPSGEWKIFHPRERGLEYGIAHHLGAFFIRTNWDAQNFRLMKTPETATKKENWTEVIPNREETLLEAVEVFEKFLVLEERSNGLTQLRVKSLVDDEDYYIDFNDETYVAYAGYNPEMLTTKIRFWYTSLTTPGTTYEYDLTTKERTIIKQQEVVGNFDPANYESKRIWATADDGTKIPISLVYKKGLKLDGTNPTVLYAYGSYGSSTDPTFRSSRLSLVDRGFVWAIGHIRGGEEMGRSWYENGKLLKKMNTFTDFNDCAEHLIAEGYTSSDHLYAIGGSAGGLLMGAVINLQPELYNGVIAAVPFVDVVTTMLDETIPLTTSEYDEWGNPNDKEYYEYMLSYSPYDQVKAQNYPNLLVTTGYHDSQVQYWEPAKWVAKLRELKTDTNKLLFHCNMDAGHGGASGRFEALKETAMEYAFFLDLEGLAK